MDISKRLDSIKSKIPEGVKLLAVSKTKSVELIMEAYEAGQRVFGENRVQDLLEKHSLLPNDIEWHHIGHLQTNKVKYLAPFVSLIHAVDSLKLLVEINKQAKRNDRVISCLLQVHIAEEETKFGFAEGELLDMISKIQERKPENIRIKGLMGMATYTNDENQIRKEFHNLHCTFERLKREFSHVLPDLNELSMGMSGDYPIAIEEGSTMIRVGSLIFGSRQ